MPVSSAAAAHTEPVLQLRPNLGQRLRSDSESSSLWERVVWERVVRNAPSLGLDFRPQANAASGTYRTHAKSPYDKIRVYFRDRRLSFG